MWRRKSWCIPLFLGALLRFYALTFGTGYGVLFGDELPAVEHTSRLVANFLFSPVRLSGQFFYFINAPFYYLLSIFYNHTFNPRYIYDVPVFYRVCVGRFLNALLGIGLILLVYFIARKLWGSKAAFWSSLLISISPTLIIESHFNTTTTLLLFLISLTIYFLIKLEDNFRYKFLFFAIISSTFALLTKPNGIFVLLLVGGFGFILSLRKENINKKYLLPIYVFLVLILIIRGKWLLHLVEVFVFQYQKGMSPLYAWEWLIKYEGIILYGGILGVLFAKKELKSITIKFLLFISLFYSLGSLLFQVFFVRWLLPIVLVSALLGGYGITSIDRVPATRRRIMKSLVIFALVCMAINAFYLTTNLTRDVRMQTWFWLYENVPPGARLIVQGDWLSAEPRSLRFRTHSPSDIISDPNFYINNKINYIILWRSNLDYYNWRAMSYLIDPRIEYAELYHNFEFVTSISGTILHLPFQVEMDILRVSQNEVYPPSEVVIGDGWYRADDPEQKFHWMSDHGQIFYNLPSKEPVEKIFSFDAYVFPGKGQVAIYVNGAYIGKFTEGQPGILRHASYKVTLQPGINEIRLVAENGCGRPIIYDKNSKDQRCLSIKVTNIQVSSLESNVIE